MLTEPYFLHVFVLNIFLTFIDAAIGYHAAPALVQLADTGETGAEPAVRGIRSLLAVVVALYTFFNCHAFFNAQSSMLLLVTAVVGVDILAQLMLRSKANKRKQQ